MLASNYFLMSLIRVSVTRGVTALPLKEKSRPEIEMNA
jgi:hypothetical protein